MACFERACVIARVYLQELEKVRRNVLRLLPAGLCGISRVLTTKIKKWRNVKLIIAKVYENRWERVRCPSKTICKTAV